MNDFNRENLSIQVSPPGLSNLEGACRAHMAANGLSFEGVIEADGQIHRFSAEGHKNRRDEWFVGHGWVFQGREYLVVSYGSWRNPEAKCRYESWKETDPISLSEEERGELNRYLKQIERQAEEERKKRHDEAADEAKRIWSSATKDPTVDEHRAYLRLKGIEPLNARFGKNPSGHESIILALWNIEGKIRSLQFVSVDQSNGSVYKSFLTGERKGAVFLYWEA